MSTTIEIPDVPTGYEKTDEIRRPVKGVDELCLVFGGIERVFWANSMWKGLERNPDMCGPIATRKKTQIDMSRMVGQFCMVGNFGVMEKLLSVESGDRYQYVTDGDTYDSCTPIYDHPYAHTGGECPVPEGFEYKVTLRNDVIWSSKDFSLGDPRVRFGWKYCASIDDNDVIFIEFIAKLEGYKL